MTDFVSLEHVRDRLVEGMIAKEISHERATKIAQGAIDLALETNSLACDHIRNHECEDADQVQFLALQLLSDAIRTTVQQVIEDVGAVTATVSL